MKAFWQLLAICILVTSTAQVSRAQLLLDTVNPLTQDLPSADGIGTPFSTTFSPGSWLPGRLWMEVNLTDNGLGYEGSFATIGGKTRLFSDAFDGRWLGEANFNMGLESGGFFYNLGIERSFSIDSANSDFVIGAWFDSDNDDQSGSFSHNFHQVGVSGGLKTPFFDLTGNGYFPVGTTDFTQGDPTGAVCFFNHNIVLQPGIDSALQGFDATLSIRPEAFAMYGGSFQLGGYQYSSDLVDAFTGVRVGSSFRAVNSMIVSGEFTYDDRFDATGFVSLGWVFGGPGGDQDYGITGRDLEKTRRQAHVARFNQELILAINPATGLPYTVRHVDNTAAPGGPGTFESRYDELIDAEIGSNPDDIIFVHRGDGTDRNQDVGIILQDGQQLLGAGVEHIIDTQFGGFVLCNDIDGRRARISNDGGPAVTLANGNTVRGLIMDGAGINMTHGILGTGVTDGIIENNIIRRASLNGVTLDFVAGDWIFAENVINRSGQDGVNIANAVDPTSEFLFRENNFSANLRDGLNMNTYDGDRFFFVDNITNNNLRHGVHMTDYIGTGSNWVFLRSISGSNGDAGMRIEQASGIFDFLDITVSNNTGSGIHLIDVESIAASDRVFIGVLDATTNIISGNGTGAGAGIESVLNSGTQNLVIRDNLINDNGLGILTRANNVGTVMNISIIENSAISNNASGGIQVVSDAGATSNVLIGNLPTSTRLNMNNNGGFGGHGIGLFAENGGLSTSTINAEITGINLNNTGAGATDAAIFGSVDRDALLNATISNVFVTGTSGDGFAFDLDSNNTAISNIFITGVDISGAGNNGIDFNVTRAQLAHATIVDSNVDGSGNNGIQYTANTGSASILDVRNSFFTTSGVDGMDIDTFGTSELLLYLDRNVASGNTRDGLNLNAGGDGSRLSARLNSNSFTGNGEFGAFMRTSNNPTDTDAGILAVIMDDNIVSNNDTLALNGRDMNVFNDDLGEICISMTNNSFVLPVRFTNTGAPVNFVVELDGSTNTGASPPILVGGAGNFDLRAFGAVCEPYIGGPFDIVTGFGREDFMNTTHGLIR